MPSVESFIKIDTIKEEHINKVKDKIKGATFEIPYRDWLDKKKPESLQCTFRLLQIQKRKWKNKR